MAHIRPLEPEQAEPAARGRQPSSRDKSGMIQRDPCLHDLSELPWLTQQLIRLRFCGYIGQDLLDKIALAAAGVKVSGRGRDARSHCQFEHLEGRLMMSGPTTR